MKSITIVFLFCTGALAAQTSMMRRNFGLADVITRIDLGWYNDPTQTRHEGRYGYLGKSESGMLTNKRLEISSAFMINNVNVKHDSERLTPNFMILGAQYNDQDKATTLSFAYGLSTNCYMGFLGFKKICGIYYAGLQYRTLPAQKHEQLGAKIGFTGYSKNYGIQIAATVYQKALEEQQLLVNFYIYRRVYKGFLLHAGLENNMPKSGLSYIWKSWRLNASVMSYKHKIQYGGSLTLNI
jgi:hypothetical protein